MFVGLFCSALYPSFPFSNFFPSLFLSPDGVVGHWPLLSSFLPSLCLSFFPGGVDWALFCSVLSCSVPAVPFPLFVCFPSVFLPPGMVGSVRFCARPLQLLFFSFSYSCTGCGGLHSPLCSKLCVRWGHAPPCFHLLSIVSLVFQFIFEWGGMGPLCFPSVLEWGYVLFTDCVGLLFPLCTQFFDNGYPMMRPGFSLVVVAWFLLVFQFIL